MGADAYGTLELKAAALLESAARNHSLIDGNKRSSWTLMVLFLWINGYRHDFTTDDAFDLVVGVAAGKIALEDSAARIAPHLVARQKPPSKTVQRRLPVTAAHIPGSFTGAA